MLAGNVLAFPAGISNLDLEGDAAANSVQIWQNSSGDIKVQGIGTKVNGTDAVQTFSGITDLFVDLKAGADFIKVFNITQIDNVTVAHSGGGNKTVQVMNVNVGNNIEIDTLGGNDVVTVSNCHMDDFLLINTGDGKDSVVVSNCNAQAGMNVQTFGSSADGNDVVAISKSSSGDYLNVLTGNGSDVVTISGFTAGTDASSSITVKTYTDDRDGSDVVMIANASAYAIEADTGNGSDVVTMINCAGGNFLTVDTSATSGGSDNDVVVISGCSAGESVIVDTGIGTDTVSLNQVVASASMRIDMGDGNYDSLVVTNSTVVNNDAIFIGGGNTGDTLVLARDHFPTKSISGFRYVIS